MGIFERTIANAPRERRENIYTFDIGTHTDQKIQFREFTLNSVGP